MAAERSLDRTAWIAATAAAVMVGWHVAARAARDAIFLTEYTKEQLPYMVIGGAVVSVALVPVVSRLNAALSPSRFVPGAFATSAAALVGLSAIYAGSPRAVAILLFLLIAAMGAVLISGFWSVVNEVFDPRSAKQLVARIGGAASAGGLAGGLLTTQMAGRLSVATILIVLASMHVVCSALVLRVGRAVPEQRHPPAATAASSTNGLAILAEQPYLRNIAFLAVGVAVSGALVDYVFKAAASDVYQGEELLRFFAWFYTAVALGTLVLQSLGTRLALKSLGLGRSIALQPVALGAGGICALLVPGIVGAAAVFAAEGVVRNSIYRAGYELLYVPVDRAAKRRVKPVIDVGFERLADAIGGGLVLAVIALGTATEPVLLGVVVLLAVGTFGLSLLLDRGYVATLEQSLMARAGSVDMLDDLADGESQHVVLRTLGTMKLSELDPSMSQVLATGMLQAPRDLRAPSEGGAPPRAVPFVPQRADAVVDRIVALRSAALDKVSKALLDPLGPEHVPHAIALLAWNEAAPLAAKALSAEVPQITGQLVDALLDPDQSFAVRRRVPGCLVANGDQRTVDGLVLGLADRRFEVKYRCGRALHAIHARAPTLTIPRKRIVAEVLKTAKVSRPVWEGRSLLDGVDEDTLSVAGQVLRERSNRSLEHVFTLLALILQAEPLRVAYQGLLTDDAALRGTALDYLDNVLPPPVRKALWPYLEPQDHARAAPSSAEDVVDKLLASHKSIQLNLDELRRRVEG